ncbi:uncharacterized protein EI90DRAFT_3052527 [Cantharellus anzutake]|uniref:uncharacterized protein n=1 Tax=Cantharellus anzutake TaxID=1750568 RepID=UPI001907CCE8|nr:uncharacterized protein EI90DRAFT_3052527 [Cantharellus anzutake]KAF8333599.1 hypothetical protein EI90DRAFT_3052527 [Cantharellus anzutake]
MLDCTSVGCSMSPLPRTVTPVSRIGHVGGRPVSERCAASGTSASQTYLVCDKWGYAMTRCCGVGLEWDQVLWQRKIGVHVKGSVDRPIHPDITKLRIGRAREPGKEGADHLFTFRTRTLITARSVQRPRATENFYRCSRALNCDYVPPVS